MKTALEQARDALRELLAMAPAKAPAAGIIVGIEGRHKAAIKSARAAIAAANAEMEKPRPDTASLAHELWAMAQGGASVADAAARIAARLDHSQFEAWQQGFDAGRESAMAQPSVAYVVCVPGETLGKPLVHFSREDADKHAAEFVNARVVALVEAP